MHASCGFSKPSGCKVRVRVTDTSLKPPPAAAESRRVQIFLRTHLLSRTGRLRLLVCRLLSSLAWPALELSCRSWAGDVCKIRRWFCIEICWQSGPVCVKENTSLGNWSMPESYYLTSLACFLQSLLGFFLLIIPYSLQLGSRFVTLSDFCCSQDFLSQCVRFFWMPCLWGASWLGPKDLEGPGKLHRKKCVIIPGRSWLERVDSLLEVIWETTASEILNLFLFPLPFFYSHPILGGCC